MSDTRRETGRLGELIAAAYLRRRGYGIIARNWRYGRGEIDLIANDGPVLVFVEVRTRRSQIEGIAEESIGPAKQRRLLRLAQAYLQQIEAQARPWIGAWRIDVVAVQLAAGTDRARISHIEYAVEDNF